MTTDDDRALVHAFQSGDRSAFDALVLKHQDRLFNLCYWFMADEQEARDMAQEVFVKILRGLPRFRGEASFATWSYRIAVNTCKNRIKSLEYRFRKMVRSFHYSTEDSRDGLLDRIADQGLSPAAALEQKERMVQIQAAIANLSPSAKSVIILRDIEGLSYDEIAKVTGLAIGTVKSRLARARARLRQQLGGIR